MKIEAKLLKQAIEKVAVLCQKGSLIPGTDMVAIQMKSGSLSVVAGDGTISSSAKVVDGVSSHSFSVMVRPGDVTNFLGLAPAWLEMYANTGDGAFLEFSSPGGRWKFGASSDTHPATRRMDAVTGATVDMPDWWVREVLAAASKFSSEDEDKPALVAVRVDGRTVVATDAHKIVAIESEDAFTGTIPSKAVAAISKMDDGLGCRVTEGNGLVSFEFNSGTVVFPVASNPFPEWRNVMPESGAYRFDAGTKELKGVLSRMFRLAGEDGAVHLSFEAGQLVVRSATKSPGESGDGSVERMNVSWASETPPAGFVIAFKQPLRDAVGTVTDGGISFEIESPRRGAILRYASGGGNAKAVVMPMMIT